MEEKDPILDPEAANKQRIAEYMKIRHKVLEKAIKKHGISCPWCKRAHKFTWLTPQTPGVRLVKCGGCQKIHPLIEWVRTTASLLKV